MGSAGYMAEGRRLRRRGLFRSASRGFVEVAYPQGQPAFTPYMAFIDAVMNLGWAGTRALIDRMDAG